MLKLQYDEYDAWLVYETPDELLKVRMVKDRPSKEEALAAAIRFCKTENEHWSDPVVLHTLFIDPVLSCSGVMTSSWCVYHKRINVTVGITDLKQTEIYTRAITALEEDMNSSKMSRFDCMLSVLESVKDSNTIELVTISSN